MLVVNNPGVIPGVNYSDCLLKQCNVYVRIVNNCVVLIVSLDINY